MLSTRVLAIWLLAAGILWAVAAIGAYLVMSGISVSILPRPLLFLLYYAAPVVLIIGASLVLAKRWPRVGAILALVACAYLTYSVAPDYIPLLQPKPPLEAPRAYAFFAVLAVVVIVTDAAAVAMAFRTIKASNQAMQRTAGRSAI